MKQIKFTKNLLTGFAISAMAFCFTACDTDNDGRRDNVDVTVNDNRDTTSYQTSTTWIRERDDYRTGVRTRYDTIQTRFRNWSNDARDDSREFRTGFERRMDTLGQKIDRMGNAAEAEWQELKRDIDRNLERAEREWDSVSLRRNNR